VGLSRLDSCIRVRRARWRGGRVVAVKGVATPMKPVIR
jgi:hypothetical protein